jgi:protease htpX homolog
LKKLDKSEIEAVAAHELTHIINKDSLLMLITVVYIGAISILGEFLVRFSTGRKRSDDDEKKGNPLLIVGLVLLVLGYVVYPLIRLAISRKREFLADAGAVELTKDNQAMISALQKISEKSVVPLENERMAAMFIANPLDTIVGLFQTHPSIQERIAALKNY